MPAIYLHKRYEGVEKASNAFFRNGETSKAGRYPVSLDIRHVGEKSWGGDKTARIIGEKCKKGREYPVNLETPVQQEQRIQRPRKQAHLKSDPNLLCIDL